MEIALLLRTLAAFALIGAVLFGLRSLGRLALLRNIRGPTAGGRLVTVVETTPLAQGASLHVVRIGEVYTVIGTSGSDLRKIGDVPPASVAAWVAARRPRT